MTEQPSPLAQAAPTLSPRDWPWSMIQGPDPNPVKPRYRLPTGACDAHCPIFGPQTKFPYVAGAAFLPPDAPFEHMRRLHEFLGFDRAVIVQPNPHGADNGATLDGIARSEGRYRGVAVVRDGITDNELQALHDGGIRGIRFTFLARLGGEPDIPAFERLCARVKPLGWHVVLYFGPGGLPLYADLMERMSVPFVVDQMGAPVPDQGLEQPAFTTLLELMKTHSPGSKSPARNASRPRARRSTTQSRLRAP